MLAVVGEVGNDVADPILRVLDDIPDLNPHLRDHLLGAWGGVDELEEGGISATLTDYYAKWRRGTLIQRAHWENWPTTVTGAGSH